MAIKNIEVAAKATKLIVTKEHIRQMRGNKSCGYIQMPPLDFLKLTTTNTSLDHLKEDVATLEQYNAWAQRGDNIIPPFLDVEVLNEPVGEVVGHEGRHRALACVNNGVKLMPVFLTAVFNRTKKYRVSKYPDDASKPFDYRSIEASDFPSVFLGQFRTVSVTVDLSSWKSIT